MKINKEYHALLAGLQEQRSDILLIEHCMLLSLYRVYRKINKKYNGKIREKIEKQYPGLASYKLASRYWNNYHYLLAKGIDCAQIVPHDLMRLKKALRRKLDLIFDHNDPREIEEFIKVFGISTMIESKLGSIRCGQHDPEEQEE